MRRLDGVAVDVETSLKHNAPREDIPADSLTGSDGALSGIVVLNQAHDEVAHALGVAIMQDGEPGVSGKADARDHPVGDHENGGHA